MEATTASRWRTLGHELAGVGLIALVYLASAWISLWLVAQPQGNVVVWPASGFLLASLLLSSRQSWRLIIPTVFLALLVANLTVGNSLAVSLGFALANCCESALAAWLLDRFIGAPLTFSNLREVLGLVGLAAILSNFFTALLGAAVVSFGFGSPFWPAWQVWWIAAGVGMMIVTPLAVVWWTGINKLKAFTWGRSVEAVLLLITLIVFAQFVFGIDVRNENFWFLFPYVMLPLLVWATLRFDLLGAVTALALLAVIVVWNTTHGSGPFTLVPEATDQVLAAQAFLSVAALTILTLAAVMVEHKQAKLTLEEAYTELERRVKERTVELSLSNQNLQTEINEHYQAEAKLRQSREYLEELIEKRTAELTRANKQLQAEIGERKRAQEELNFQKSLLECQSEAILDGILMVSLEHEWLFFNRHFIEMWRMPAEVVQARSSKISIPWALEQLVNPEQFMAQIEFLADRPEAISQIELRLKDGRTFERYSAPVQSEAGVHFGRVWYDRDITQAKRTEEALRDSEAKSRALVNTAVDGIITIDKGGRITSFNPSAERLFGYGAGEVIGRKINILMPSPYQEEHDRYMLDYQMTGIRKMIGIGREVAGQRKDGTTFPLDLSVSEIRLGGQRLFTGIVRDISERKQAEVKQAQLLQELESVNRELNDFAYVVSHDLKAPLRAIGSLASWLATDYAEQLGPEGQEQLDLLVGRVKRMHALIDGILQYSRVARSREEREVVNLNYLLAEVVEMLGPPAQIDIRLENDLPGVTGERTRLQQLLQNLLSNAIKFMDKPQGEIRIGCTALEDAWQIHVADNGPGIEAKHFGKIFQLFQTLTPRDEFESTGVGLALVKKIVELHGGKIWVESTVGQGMV